jgi:hypothetical protein
VRGGVREQPGSVGLRLCARMLACMNAWACAHVYRTEKDLGTVKSLSVMSRVEEIKDLNGAPKN